MKRIKLTEAQVNMLQLNEGRIDISKAIEPQVKEVNSILSAIAEELKPLTIYNILEKPSRFEDMMNILEPLDDTIYSIGRSVDDYNEDPRYGDNDRYIVKKLNSLELRRRELYRVARIFSKLAKESNFTGDESFDIYFK